MHLYLVPLLMILALPAQAQAQPAARPAAPGDATAASPSPERTTATFGDWIFRCEARGAARSCELHQTLQDQRGQPVAQFAVGRAARNQPMRLVILIPVNVTTTAPLRLNLDDGGTPLPVTLRACGPRGCVADAELNAAAITRIRGREAPGRLEYRDAANAELNLPFSPRGFGQALDAFNRESN